MNRAATAAREGRLRSHEDRWRLQLRAAWLRPAVLLVLVANLWAGEQHGDQAVHLVAVATYALATATAIILAGFRYGPDWMGAVFIAFDALLVLALIHEHLLPLAPGSGHAVTTAVMAGSFLLLSHSALWLRPKLVALFTGLVLAGWLPMVAYVAWSGQGQQHSPALAAEAALAAAFAFAALTLLILIFEHERVVRSAVQSERIRANLSRFFAPAIVAELETSGESTALERRYATVMFVDLRSFTQIAEGMEPLAVARLLSEYRELVVASVFAWGGTIDKFIGDGVMAVFGHPRAAPDDAARAFRCAEELAARLQGWSGRRRRDGEIPIQAGIGLHYGEVVAGLLTCGNHSEFSVFGDAVNVAERLERASKQLNASVVASAALVSRIPADTARERWIHGETVNLDGGDRRIEVAYIPRPTDAVSRANGRSDDLRASCASERAAC